MTEATGADRQVNREALVPLMAAMAEGSTHALFEFVERFRVELERMVGGILVSLHRRDLARSPGEVASLAVSAGMVLFQRAKGWRADGALPWVWAYRSIRHEVVTQVGHPTVPFEPAMNADDTAAPAMSEDEVVVDLRRLAERHDGIAAWLGAVDVVANERDRQVHLEYQMQKRLGDPSPAITVGAMFDLTPANVRQIDRRVRQRLSALSHPNQSSILLAAGAS